MLLDIQSEEVRVNTNKIFTGANLVFIFLVFVAFLVKLAFGLPYLNSVIIATFLASSVIIGFLSFRSPDAQWLRTIFIVEVYCFIEVHFLANPSLSSVIIYWLALVPIISLLLRGFKSSQVWAILVLVSHLGNHYYLTQILGHGEVFSSQLLPTLIEGLIFVSLIMACTFSLHMIWGHSCAKLNETNTQLTQLKHDIEDKKTRIERYQEVFISFLRNQKVLKINQDKLFRKLCETTVQTLNVSRVSIWLMEGNNSRIERRFLYENEHGDDQIVVLQRADYPRYFEALENQPYIVANEARTNQDTSEFTSSYLVPLSIYSLLDCPIIVNNKIIGIICCEEKYQVRKWEAEEALFIQLLANVIALSYKNQEVRSLLQKLEQNNVQLVEKKEQIENMYSELNSLNKELNMINDRLEETVELRTAELEAQNSQLSEYAFINSHLLRAPIAKILGVSNLIKNGETTDGELLNILKESTEELDSIIRKISEMLGEGDFLIREEVQTIISKYSEDLNT